MRGEYSDRFEKAVFNSILQDDCRSIPGVLLKWIIELRAKLFQSATLYCGEIFVEGAIKAVGDVRELAGLRPLPRRRLPLRSRLRSFIGHRKIRIAQPLLEGRVVLELLEQLRMIGK